MNGFARHLATLPIFGLSLVPLVSAAQDQAGVSAGVRGDVQLASGQVGAAIRSRPAKSGEQIFLGDRIASGAESGMQVLLLDETTFTVGADSQVTIDEFVYNPATGAGKVSASIGKGVFRFVSGKVAQNEPRNMTVRTPIATIGVRGTAVWGDIGDGRALIALAGPGKENNSGDKPGGIDVITPDGTARIDRPGFGAEVIRGQAPRIIPIPPEMAQRVLGALSRRSAPAPANGGGAAAAANPANDAGQTAAVALEDVLSSTRTGDTQTFAEVARTVVTESGSVGGITSFEQLRTVKGTGIYTITGVPLSGSGGSGAYNFNSTVNFDNFSQFSTFTITSSPYGSISFSVSPFNFSTSTGNAVFSGSTNYGANAVAEASFRFVNSNGVASTFEHTLTATDTLAGTSITGSGTHPR